MSDKTKRNMDGIVFDSIAEMQRYAELKMRERAGMISGLKLQPRFTIIDKTPRVKKHFYTADFMYRENGQTIVEEVKGFKTPGYALRRDIFLCFNPGIKFRENHNGIIKEY